MKKSRKLITIICSLLMIALIITMSFAWFFTFSDLEIDNQNEIVCEASSSIKINVKDPISNTWTGYGPKAELKTKASLKDISGDGKSFYIPDSLDANNEADTTSFKPATPVGTSGTGDYIEFEAKIKSKDQVDIYLDELSTIAPLNPVKPSQNPSNENFFGDFSRDYIAASMRVAILEKVGADEVLKTIWAPNSQYKLSQDETGYKLIDLRSEDNNVDFLPIDEPSIERRPEEYCYFVKDNTNYVKHNVTLDEYLNKQFIFSNVKIQRYYPYIAQKSPFSPILTTINPSVVGQEAEKTLIIRVWFEGTDRETSEALAGGLTKMNLKFKGLNTKRAANEIEKQLINNIVFDEVTGRFKLSQADNNKNIQYSINGFDWYIYNSEDKNPTSLYTFENSLIRDKDTKTVYFKLVETDTYYEYIRRCDVTYVGKEVPNV